MPINQVQINFPAIHYRVYTSNRQTVRKAAVKEGEKFVRHHRTVLLKDINNHEVSQEIKEGETAENTSGLLGGGDLGNLFSFIGFYQNDKPVQELIKWLREQIYFDKRLQLTKDKGGKEYHYIGTAKRPTIYEIWAVTQTPWNGSWVRGIERGISGLGHYIYRMNIAGSRSGTGVQKKGASLYRVQTPSIFKTSPYVGQLIKEFDKKIKEGYVKGKIVRFFTENILGLFLRRT